MTDTGIAEDKLRIVHTPTPWGVEAGTDALWIGPMRSNGKVDEIVFRLEASDDYRREFNKRQFLNAGFIVKAANAYEELMNIIQRLADGERSEDGHTALREAAKAALEKAK